MRLDAGGSVVEATPLAGTSGVAVTSVVRVKYSETVNPTKYRGPPVALTGPAGAVEGRTDFAFGNTTLVFTPVRPLSQDALLGLFSGSAVGRDVVLEPATAADMTGGVVLAKPSLEVIYDDAA